MSSVQHEQKVRGCVLGALLADAATTPLHWIYDVNALKTTLNEANALDAPEFFPTPKVPFYKTTTGKLSPYGGEYVALLGALSKQPSDTFDATAIEMEFASFFATWDGYKNHSIKTFESNFKEGLRHPKTACEKDNQANGMVKAPLISAVYGSSSSFESSAKNALILTQSFPTAVEYGWASSVIINKVLVGANIPDAIASLVSDETVSDTIHADVKDVLDNQEKDIASLGKAWGISCSYPGAFKLALAIALQSNTYKEVVRKNIVVGGDNCSRGMFLGGLFGAAYPEQVPKEWCEKVIAFDQFEHHINQLCPEA